MTRPDLESETTSHDPPPIGGARLRQFVAYARTVFGLDALLGGLRDRRHQPRVPTALVARIVLLLGVLRIRSFNALEPKLAEGPMQRALGARIDSRRKVCSVDTLGYSLARAEVASFRIPVVQVVQKAERNKVFREGWIGALRVVALDGWEPFCSYDRHCSACLTRLVTVKRNGVEEKRTQYYHAFVVAMLVDERLDLVIDMEAIRSADVRAEAGEQDVRGHEGELTAAKRLVPRLRDTYGRWIDALVGDALYANGPFLSIAKQARFGVFVILRKEANEPLKDALAIWKKDPPQKVIEHKHERIELWDCAGIETLSTYDGPIRVVRGRVTDSKDSKVHTWCIGATGCATRLSAAQVLYVGRGRWHIENTGFHQFAHRWNLGHVFTHGADAIPALFWIFILAFNLLQLFLYRQLRTYGRDRGRDVTQTISRLVDEMIDDLARFGACVAWDSS